MDLFNLQWRSVLSQLKLEVVKALHVNIDGEAFQAASEEFISFASAHEGIFNDNPVVRALVMAFTRFASPEFPSLPISEMAERLQTLSDYLDAAIAQTVGMEAPENSGHSEVGLEESLNLVTPSPPLPEIAHESVIALISDLYPILSPREAQVAYWLARDKSSPWIAMQLGIPSVRTVESHVTHIAGRLGILRGRGTRQRVGDMIRAALAKIGVREFPVLD